MAPDDDRQRHVLEALGRRDAGLTLKDANGDTVVGDDVVQHLHADGDVHAEPALNGFVTVHRHADGHRRTGQPDHVGQDWSFTTAKPPGAPGVCPCSLFDDSTVPTVMDSGETQPLTLGGPVRLQPRRHDHRHAVLQGTEQHRHPYRNPLVCERCGLATGTFASESTSGWQTLTFAQPVSITKNTEYVASYTTPTGSLLADTERVRSEQPVACAAAR